ncbi:hypothetical protein [Novilysobacter spongiicola]|uniref:Uncharacterized protein n=1 Tax=Lysobacter spongiicola DSM 21749 TaxID=1122188 RepID=A0A1T4RZ51_9GAMM|nr:hypothetical protein [Lysobacter spongiicola]SKA21253.1 hypothetical protein SAMN02745674_02461 [Lysobacter spongiicola DSM 21749]
MTSQTFRFDSHHFQSRMRAAFEPRKPRHPLVRFAVGLLGLALLVVLVMFSVALGAAMLVAGVAWKLLAGRGARKTAHADPRVVEGEYRVLRKPLLRR